MNDTKKEIVKPKRNLVGKKNKQNRETVGKIITDLKAQYTDKDFAEVSDIGKHGTQSLMDKIWEHALQKKDELQCVFFLSLKKWKDPITGSHRTQLYSHIACPSPDFFQSVWRFDPRGDKLEYLWSLPGPQRCVDMYNNKDLVPPEEWWLLSYVIRFLEDDLDKFCIALNDPSRPSPETLLSKKETYG